MPSTLAPLESRYSPHPSHVSCLYASTPDTRMSLLFSVCVLIDSTSHVRGGCPRKFVLVTLFSVNRSKLAVSTLVINVNRTHGTMRTMLTSAICRGFHTVRRVESAITGL